MSQDIVLLTGGTRGDVQPYIALGLGLQAAGRSVRLAAPAPFRRLVEAWGLPFAAYEGDPSALLNRPGGQAALAWDGSLLRSARASLAYVRQARPFYARMLANAWQACQGAGALVVGLPTTWGASIARALGVPCLWAFLQPFGRTGAFPSAVFPNAAGHGQLYNRLTYYMVEQAIWQPWRSLTNRWREGLLGLPAERGWGPLGAISRAETPVLYAFSRHVVPPPPDWPASHAVTGYWFLPPRPGWQPDPQLVRFLASGPPPVYVGFGSPGTPDPEGAVARVLAAVRQAGLRAVFGLPGGLPQGLDLPPEVLPVQEVEHAWLFPCLAGVVHHGGAGTTAAGLQAGLPSLLLPLAVDQFFWARRVAALGAGPPPIPRRALSGEGLGAALLSLVQTPAYRQHAASLGEALRGENGVDAAVENINNELHQ